MINCSTNYVDLKCKAIGIVVFLALWVLLACGIYSCNMARSPIAMAQTMSAAEVIGSWQQIGTTAKATKVVVSGTTCVVVVSSTSVPSTAVSCDWR